MDKTPPKAKYQVDQFFMHKEKKAIFKIVNAQYQSIIQKPSRSKVKLPTTLINDWLYDIEYQGANQGKYGKYYENRLTTECEILINQEMASSIYD